jgi:hypothetical protein
MLTFWMTAGLLWAADGPVAADLQLPVRVEAAGKPLDVERDGHSAPFVGDYDGDGVRDLLVGQYHEGRLRIYRNHGSDTSPLYGEPEMFEGRVPEG